MNRKSRIASAVVSAVLLLALAPVSVYAGSPLLSGYGGPGAGEQAIVGSTLLGGPRGGAGSGGSPGTSSGGGGEGTSSRSNVVPTGGTSASASPTGSSGTPGHSPSSDAAGSSGARPTHSRAFVYPSVPASERADSSVIGISSADVFLLIAVLATIAIVGVLTVRLSRLQP